MTTATIAGENTATPRNNFQGEISIAPLTFHSVPHHSTRTLAYFHYYGIDPPGAAHYFGSFKAGKYELAAHVFKPERPRGTIFLLHGYLDHTGALKHLIAFCVQQQYAVAVFDLPGHGLSSGERTHISKFHDYTEILESFIGLCAGAPLPKPFHAIGHSTGGAILIDRLYTQGEAGEKFDKMILLAPLVRSAKWTLSRIGHALLGSFVNTIPRKVPSSSSDQAFIQFLRQDPLRGESVHMDWIDALFEWEAALQGRPVMEKPVLVIQGNEDQTVDWKHNIPFLKEKLIRMRLVILEGAKHQLMNEIPEFRNQVTGHIRLYLEAAPEDRRDPQKG